MVRLIVLINESQFGSHRNTKKSAKKVENNARQTLLNGGAGLRMSHRQQDRVRGCKGE
jgi:hypothetical protein